MREIKIRTSKEYSVFVTSGTSNLNLLFDSAKIKKIFLITDENVYNSYENFFEGLSERIQGIYIIKPGEESKSLNVISKIYEELIKTDVNRKTAIVSAGGGIAGDLAGFIASTYMRGLILVHIPTTLMAQCDGSIGGKNGFNFMGIKNVIGTFYQPHFVYTDVNFLKTLSSKEYLNGVAEVVKYGFVCDEGLFKYIEENKKGIKEREVDKLLHMVYECTRIKGEVLEKYEFDSEARNILNFGHTMGYGIEGASDFKLLHGESVFLGMKIEAYISWVSGYLAKSSYDRLIDIIDYFMHPFDILDFDTDKVLYFINKDKKRTASSLKFVLPDKIGHAIISTDIRNNVIKDGVNNILYKSRR